MRSKLSALQRSPYGYAGLLITLQLSVFILLFAIFPKRVSRTFLPIQPDSLNYICKGLKNSTLTSSEQRNLLKSLSRYFLRKGDPDLVCGDEPIFYHPRRFLSFLISEFADAHILFSLILPTIILCSISTYFYWKLTKDWVISGGFAQLILALAPWLSPHIGWYSFLVLTEGPLICAALGLILLANQNWRFWLWFPAALAFISIGILSRQSWPAMGALLAFAIVRRTSRSQIKSVLGIYLVSQLMAFAASQLIIGSSQYTTKNGFSAAEVLTGIRKGIVHDSVHLLKLGDIFGVLILTVLLVEIARIREVNSWILLISLTGFGVLSIGSVYLMEFTYGQNWRFFVLATISVIPIIANSKTKNYLGRKATRS